MAGISAMEPKSNMHQNFKKTNKNKTVSCQDFGLKTGCKWKSSLWPLLISRLCFSNVFAITRTTDEFDRVFVVQLDKRRHRNTAMFSERKRIWLISGFQDFYKLYSLIFTDLCTATWFVAVSIRPEPWGGLSLTCCWPDIDTCRHLSFF